MHTHLNLFWCFANLSICLLLLIIILYHCCAHDNWCCESFIIVSFLFSLHTLLCSFDILNTYAACESTAHLHNTKTHTLTLTALQFLSILFVSLLLLLPGTSNGACESQHWIAHGTWVCSTTIVRYEASFTAVEVHTQWFHLLISYAQTHPASFRAQPSPI